MATLGGMVDAMTTLRWTLHEGDCREALRTMEADSVESVVTDPPYELAFMGKRWDASGIAFSPAFWAEVLRVLKPGAHCLAFGGTRTSHRMVCAMEDAGLEIRDSIHWHYGSGFPKSLDVSRAIDMRPGVVRHAEFAAHIRTRREALGLSYHDVSVRVVGARTGACWNWEHHQFPEAKWWPALRDLLGLDEQWGPVVAKAEREKIGSRTVGRLAVAPGQQEDRSVVTLDVDTPATDAAKQWEGFGTALKPSHEPVVLARKPPDGTVAANVQRWGTGALNIDGCRIPGMPSATRFDPAVHNHEGYRMTATGSETAVNAARIGGRWPPNTVLVHSAACGDTCAPDCPVAEMDRQSGTLTSGDSSGFIGEVAESAALGDKRAMIKPSSVYADTGGASRFFPVFEWSDLDVPPFRYEPKASRAERDLGCGELPVKSGGEATDREDGSAALNSPRTGAGRTGGVRNNHPTVKPVALVRWLCRLITPPNGLVLDPFTGSGTTGVAALMEEFRFVGCEREPEYITIARARIAHAAGLPVQRSLFARSA